jgi:arsenate reductase (thioredoxin)
VQRVLFVCVENSNRSQMSEAFARIHGSHVLEAYSAGSRPSGIVNPKAIQAMNEVGYALQRHRSKSLDEVPEGPYDYVITMGCGDDCPLVPALQRADWPLPDPKAMPPEEFNSVRDEIERRVKQLVAEIARGRP